MFYFQCISWAKILFFYHWQLGLFIRLAFIFRFSSDRVIFFNKQKVNVMNTTATEKFVIDKFTANDFIRLYCLHFDIDLESSGSTTFRSEDLEKGVEPDECFYIQSVEKVSTKLLVGRNLKPFLHSVRVKLEPQILRRRTQHESMALQEQLTFDKV